MPSPSLSTEALIARRPVETRGGLRIRIRYRDRSGTERGRARYGHVDREVRGICERNSIHGYAAAVHCDRDVIWKFWDRIEKSGAVTRSAGDRNIGIELALREGRGDAAVGVAGGGAFIWMTRTAHEFGAVEYSCTVQNVMSSLGSIDIVE